MEHRTSARAQDHPDHCGYQPHRQALTAALSKPLIPRAPTCPPLRTAVAPAHLAASPTSPREITGHASGATQSLPCSTESSSKSQGQSGARQSRDPPQHWRGECLGRRIAQRRQDQRTGITRRSGPGCDLTCARRPLSAPKPYLCDRGTSGLPSPSAARSRMPFVLTTPGGQPVPLLDQLRFPGAFLRAYVGAAG
jgi:hypothetical protein